MPRQVRSDSRGFTLVEALIALALMAVAGVAVAQLSSVATRVVHAGRARTVSALAAAGALAELADARLALTAASCLQGDTVGCHDGADGAGAPAAPSGAAVYRRRWRVSDLTAGSVAARLLVVCAGPIRDMGVAPAGRPPGACLAGMTLQVVP